MSTDTIIIIAAAGFGTGISGGDRIFLEFARLWKESGYRVIILTAQEGHRFCLANGLIDFEYDVIQTDYTRFNFAYAYLLRIFRSIRRAKNFHLDYQGKLIIYSASDFLADSLPGSILKKRFPQAKWMAGFYFFAPSPIPNKKDIQYRGGYAFPTPKSLIYYFLQRIALNKIIKGADLILVSNELDRRIFIERGVKENRVIPLYGGVNVKDIEKVPDAEKRYAACFVGRFHYQKGAMELLKIWEIFVRMNHNARLAIIGEGPLKAKMLDFIRQRKLENNIEMLGFLNGEAKYRIFKSSRVFLHTPILDTGGMAAAEAMAAGLPVIGFDLPGYRACYPKGMLKVGLRDLEAFATAVERLLSNKSFYEQMSQEALAFSKDWDWGKKSALVLGRINKLYEN